MRGVKKYSRLLIKCVAQLNNDDIFNWDIALIVLNPDSLYHGGYFKGKIAFPRNYPYSPPRKDLTLLPETPFQAYHASKRGTGSSYKVNWNRADI